MCSLFLLKLFWCTNWRGWVYHCRCSYWQPEAKWVDLIPASLDILLLDCFTGFRCGRWTEITLDNQPLGAYWNFLVWDTFVISGRICTELEPVDEGILSRLLRFGRSADEMHSRTKRQSEADGDIFDNAQIICEVWQQRWKFTSKINHFRKTWAEAC